MLKRRSSLVIVASILAFACALIGTITLFTNANETHAASEWEGNYTVSNEGDSVVYTAKSYDLDVLEYKGSETALTANRITYSFRPNANFTSDVANVGFYIKQPNGHQLFFNIMNHWKLYRLIRYNPSEAWLTEKRIMPEENYVSGWIGTDKWYNVEIIFTPNYVSLTVDGFLVAETFDHGINFHQATFGISSWACAPSVKDMQFSRVDIDGKWAGSFTATTENNETVYTSNDNYNVNRLVYNGELNVKEKNTVKFSFRLNDAWGGGDTANFSYVITAANGESLWLYFMGYYKWLRIIHHGATETWLKEARFMPEEEYAVGWNMTDQWFNAELLINGSFLTLNVNGYELFANLTSPISLDGASYAISTWGSQYSVKGMDFTYTLFESDWVASNQITTRENDADVFTAKSFDSSFIEYNGLENAATANKFTYYFRPNAGYGWDLADVGFYILQSNGNRLAFSLMNHWKLLRIRRWNPDEAWLAEKRYVPEESYVAGWLDTDKWFKVEIIFTQRYLSIAVDGYFVAEAFEHGMDLSQSTFGISSWNCAPSLKGMEFSKVEVADSWGGSYTKGVENEETVYTANSGDVSVLRFNKGVDTSKVNTIKYSFRPNEPYSGYDTSHSTFNIIAADGQQLSFTFMNHWKVLRVIHYGAQESWLREVRYIPEENYTAGWNAYDVWYNVEIIFTDTFASVKVNGVEVVGLVANPISLENASYALSSWGCIPTVKGIEWANTELGGDWKGANHTVEYEDGAIVHTSNILDLNTIAYTGSETCETANTFTFSFRPNESYNFDLANVGFYLQQPNGNQLYFCFINHWKLLRIFHYNPNETVIAEARYLSEEDYTPGWNAYDEWYDVEITFTDSFVSVKVNGMNVTSIVDHGFDTANAKFGMSSWSCAPSVKDMAFDKKTIEHDFKGSFSEALENGEKVYTAKSSDVNSMWYTDNTITDRVNTVSYYFRANSSYLGHDTAHASFYLKGTNGEELSFTFMNHWKLLRLINWKPEETWLGGEGVRYEKEINYTPGWNNYDQWYKVEITFTEEVLIVKVNGEEIASVVAHNFEIDGAYIGFASWGCAPSFKNIELSNTQVDMTNYRWAGLTFDKSYEDGEINYTSTGDLTVLQKLDYAGTIGNANTVSFKLKFLEDGTFGEPERNVAINVASANKANTVVAFQVMPHWNATRIQIFEGSNGTILTADNYVPTEWMEVKVVFNKNYLVAYVNGQLISASYNSLWNSFEDVGVHFSVWGTIVQIKDISFSNSEIAPEQLWYSSSFEVTEEDGETVYTAIHNGGVNALGYAGTTENYNSIEFDVRPGTIGSNNERNAGIIIYNKGSSDYLFFELMPKIKEARVRLMSGNGSAFGVKADYNASATSWIHVQCVFTNDYLAMFVNGKLVLSHFDIKGYDFTDTMIVASAWDTAASYKDFTFGSVDFTYSDLGYMDLDFVDERGLDSLRATNATINYLSNTNEVEFVVNNENPVIGVTVNQPVGGLYSVYLPLRNTVLVRMANATSASSVEIRFKNSFSQTVYTRTFEIKPNSGYETYYFNLSAGEGMTAYLRDLEFEFIGANGGTITIDAITFEREDSLAYEYAATELKCVADPTTNTVIVTGKLLPKYAGMVVALSETSAVNFAEDVNHVDNKLLATAESAADGTFRIEIPFYREEGTATHLSTIFMATISNIKLAKTFQIENYQDFIVNPYAFDLPDYVVKVTDAPYNAKGDGFTNDNAAIQAAIDAVHNAGGGVVVLPGDDSLYGRRYVATNLELCSNVELRIEKGAVLWQSPRIADYGYDVLIGHDYVTDVMWPHACNVNRPLILVRAVENVKISGGGTIRMLDHGGEDDNPWDLIDPNHSVSCGNLIHIAPLFVVSSTNVEIKDIKILRTNNWNVTSLYSTNLCVMNVTFAEGNCKNGDGVGLACVTDAFIARNRMFGTDDAFTLNANAGDPRWGSDWGAPLDTTTHSSTSNIEIAHNNMRGGLGLVFITWGSHREDLSEALIKNIVCYDNVFAGFGQDIGSWPDNPFYGWSSDDDYVLGAGEVDDYSPVQEVYMFDNVYTNGVTILGWQGDVIEAESTMFITDADYKTSSYFVNASFERYLRYDNEVNWLSGLSYWTNITENEGSVGIEARGTKQAVAKYTQNEHTVTDYAGYIDGDGKLYQGLWLYKGLYVMVATVKNEGGEAQLFVGNPLLKQHVSDANAVTVLKQQAIEVGGEYALVSFTFYVEETGVYAVGIAHQGAKGQKVYIDDVAVARDYVGEAEYEERKIAVASLTGKINLALTYSEEKYTAESYSALQAVIEEATLILNDENENAQALYEMVDLLDEAINQLEIKVERPEQSEESSTSENSSSIELSSCMGSVGGSETLIALAMVGLGIVARKKRNQK